MKGQLILENGQRFTGELFGAIKNIVGEIVFTTGMTGYQEELTDPSFAGQIVTMTFPLIGNYGINLDDNEAKHTSLKAMVVREKCDYPSNFRNEMNIADFLEEEGVVGIEGCMTAVIMQGEPSQAEVDALMAEFDNSKVILETTTDESYVVNPGGKPHIAYIDLGTKEGIIRDLVKRGCKLTVFRADVKADDILAVEPDMVFLSNGPGDPLDAPGTIDTVKALIGKLPICGICMGHQLIGLALGCKSQKLTFGHHGGNHPVKYLETGKCFITSQNHNYVLTDYPEDVEEWFTNVNDNTCEGLRHKKYPIMSVQFHPEASPGPLDTSWVFDRFLKEVK